MFSGWLVFDKRTYPQAALDVWTFFLANLRGILYASENRYGGAVPDPKSMDRRDFLRTFVFTSAAVGAGLSAATAAYAEDVESVFGVIIYCNPMSCDIQRLPPKCSKLWCGGLRTDNGKDVPCGVVHKAPDGEQPPDTW